MSKIDQKFLSDEKNAGFSLTFLLTIVFIIGILSVVAWRRYDGSVEKTRWAEIYRAERTLAQAQEAYYAANGKYCTDFNKLGVVLPGIKAHGQRFGTDVFTGNLFSSGEGIGVKFVRVKNGKEDYDGPSLVTYYGRSRQCRAKAATAADSICSWLTGGSVPSPFGPENRYYFRDLRQHSALKPQKDKLLP